MSAVGQMSANARKQREEDIERLVKCRLRSEIEARKAVESTMKRAVQEARELKKELVLLRQEKEELRVAAQKNATSGPRSGGKEPTRYGQKSSPASSKESHAAKQGSNKAVELKLRQQIQTLTSRNVELGATTNELQQQLSDIEAERATAIAQSTADLEEKDHEIASLRDDLKKAKLMVDETKRKCQKMLKEKREEAQRALQENEQLARCAKTLQGQLALLPLLKRQLEHAKEKRADVAEVWQKKLEQRDQNFLREEEASKLKMAKSEARIDELTEEKQLLQTKVDELQLKLREIDNHHETALRQEHQRLSKWEINTKQLQDKLFAAEAAARGAEEAEVVARETQEQETRLRQLAEDAADAVEVRAEKAERNLAEAQTQLARLEEALKARGVTLDYLLNQQTPISTASRTLTTKKTISTTSSAKKPFAVTSKGPAQSRTTGKLRSTETNVSSITKARRSNNNDEE